MKDYSCCLIDGENLAGRLNQPKERKERALFPFESGPGVIMTNEYA